MHYGKPMMIMFRNGIVAVEQMCAGTNSEGAIGGYLSFKKDIDATISSTPKL